MQIAYGILSANEPVGAVRQLVRALGDDDPVFVHHDFSRQPDFALDCPDAYVIPDYRQTGWGTPGFVRAVFHLVRTALALSRFDYFQLLSGSCLPTRPTADLKRHLAVADVAIHSDLLDLDADLEATMSHGHRVFSRADRPAARLLHRARRWYFAGRDTTVHRANLGVQRLDPAEPLRPLQWLGRRIHLAARTGALDEHPFRGGVTPYVGCLWFCLRRDACEYLVRQENESVLMPYLLSLPLCDEIVFPTLLGNSGFGIAGSNHLVNRFDGPHPRQFTPDDLPAIARSDRHFARKFRPDPGDPVRRSVIESLRVHRGAPAASPVLAATP